MRAIVIVSILGTCFLTAIFAGAGDRKNMPLTDSAEDFYLSNYILGPGDKLEIRVYRNDDLDFTQQIDSSGKISYPLLGDLHVAGMTPIALKKKLAAGLSKYLKDPQVMINLTAYQSNIITVIGNVNTPGVTTIDHPPKLLEIISRSGGFTSDADKTGVVVIRKNQAESTVWKLNLKKALEGDISQDILLMKNDIVYVPSNMNKVIVLGEVSSPGTVDLEKELSEAPMSLVEVITKAGGFSTNADKSEVVLIRKTVGDQTETQKYNVKKLFEKGDISQNVLIAKGDIVFVPKLEKRIVVFGEIATPGTVLFDSEISIVELLSKSSGFTDNANRNTVMVIRNNGDVPRMFSVDIEKLLKNGGDPSQNIMLEDGDIVYVPRDSKRVVVLGEVTKPGYHSFITPITLMDAISKSEGLAKTADPEKIVLVRQGSVRILNTSSILEQGDNAQNIVLQNGDIVYAPPSSIARFETFLGHIAKVFSSITQIYSPIILWPEFKDALEGNSETTLTVPIGGS